MDRETVKKISEIAKRANALATSYDIDYPVLVAFMDLDNANKHIPLDLDKLMQFNEQNFGHDIFGIRRHLNRDTKELENCFLPRSAKNQG